MISICITVKNRTRIQVGNRVIRPFIHCAESLAHAMAGTDHELIVADWQSTDTVLWHWLPHTMGTTRTTIMQLPPGPFSRGGGLNRAAYWAQGPILFFLDTDILLTQYVLKVVQDVVLTGKVFFPVCYSYRDADHKHGYWRHEGYGLAAMSRDMFAHVGRWDEFTRWGGEDRQMLRRVHAAGIPIVREPCQGLVHQWHPPMTQ